MHVSRTHGVYFLSRVLLFIIFFLLAYVFFIFSPRLTNSTLLRAPFRHSWHSWLTLIRYACYYNAAAVADVGRTDGRTDGQTDRQTDRQTDYVCCPTAMETDYVQCMCVFLFFFCVREYIEETNSVFGTCNIARRFRIHRYKYIYIYTISA